MPIRCVVFHGTESVDQVQYFRPYHGYTMPVASRRGVLRSVLEDRNFLINSSDRKQSKFLLSNESGQLVYHAGERPRLAQHNLEGGFMSGFEDIVLWRDFEVSGMIATIVVAKDDNIQLCQLLLYRLVELCQGTKTRDLLTIPGGANSQGPELDNSFTTSVLDILAPDGQPIVVGGQCIYNLLDK